MKKHQASKLEHLQEKLRSSERSDFTVYKFGGTTSGSTTDAGRIGLARELIEADLARGCFPVPVFSAMKPSAHLINVARGRVVEEAALIDALEQGKISAAGLDCTAEEPLPASSPLWGMENVIITPHTAGETRRYEDNVIDLLMENLDRLWRGESTLKNQIV